MRLTPEEIEARRFRLAPNGYECEAVDRFLAEVIEALRDRSVNGSETDEFSRAGQEIASVLRAARDSAGAMKAEAEGLAASMRSRAELEVADLRQQSELEREQAKAILIDAQQRAEAIVREAEQQSAATLSASTVQAATRATQITAEAERQAEQIRRGERAAQQRLLAARTDLQQAIDRLGGADDRPVLDLTVAPGQLRTEGTAPAAATTTADDAAPAPEADPAPTTAVPADPLLRMVRAAVGRAAEHSSSHAFEDEAPAV